MAVELLHFYHDTKAYLIGMIVLGVTMRSGLFISFSYRGSVDTGRVLTGNGT